jgi:ABC-type Fe3+/spermidine/putrescine transport system ATPase subunit
MCCDETTSGVFVIASTPFREDGAIDFNAIPRIVDFFLAHKVQGGTILGVMGEASKLTEQEALQITRAVLHAVVILERGRIAQYDAPRALYEMPASGFVASFLGECNFLEIGSRRCVLRPERLRLGSDAGALHHRIEAHVAEIRFLGPNLRVTLRNEKEEFIALAPVVGHTSDMAVGQPMITGFNSQDVRTLEGELLR